MGSCLLAMNEFICRHDIIDGTDLKDLEEEENKPFQMLFKDIPEKQVTKQVQKSGVERIMLQKSQFLTSLMNWI